MLTHTELCFTMARACNLNTSYQFVSLFAARLHFRLCGEAQDQGTARWSLRISFDLWPHVIVNTVRSSWTCSTSPLTQCRKPVRSYVGGSCCSLVKSTLLPLFLRSWITAKRCECYKCKWLWAKVKSFSKEFLRGSFSEMRLLWKKKRIWILVKYSVAATHVSMLWWRIIPH